jgi:hypothetical protein
VVGAVVGTVVGTAAGVVALVGAVGQQRWIKVNDTQPAICHELKLRSTLSNFFLVASGWALNSTESVVRKFDVEGVTCPCNERFPVLILQTYKQLGIVLMKTDPLGSEGASRNSKVRRNIPDSISVEVLEQGAARIQTRCSFIHCVNRACCQRSLPLYTLTYGASAARG